MSHLKKLRTEQNRSKASGRKEIKGRAKISQIENRKTIKKISETKSWLSERINIIDKPPAGLTEKKTEEKQKLLIPEIKEKMSP